MRADEQAHASTVTMDALRRSIAQEPAASARPAKGRKRINEQAEMLLSIAGNAKKADTARSTACPSTRQTRAS